MDDRFVLALRAAINWLESRNYRFAVIGGIANQHWGTTRITHDADLKVLVPELDYVTIHDALRTDFPDRGRPQHLSVRWSSM